MEATKRKRASANDGEAPRKPAKAAKIDVIDLTGSDSEEETPSRPAPPPPSLPAPARRPGQDGFANSTPDPNRSGYANVTTQTPLPQDRRIKFTPNEQELNQLRLVAKSIHKRLRAEAEKSGVALGPMSREILDVDIDISIRQGGRLEEVVINPRLYLGEGIDRYFGEEEEEDDDEEVVMTEPWRPQDGRLNTPELLNPSKRKE